MLTGGISSHDVRGPMVLLPGLGVVVCQARSFVLRASGARMQSGACGSYPAIWFKARPRCSDGFFGELEAVRSRRTWIPTPCPAVFFPAGRRHFTAWPANHSVRQLSAHAAGLGGGCGACGDDAVSQSSPLLLTE
eukprot:1550698-Alexandrium_andersonii.AAC.1